MALIGPLVPEPSAYGRREKRSWWEDAGLTEKLPATLRAKARLQQSRAPEPSAGIIDSQRVKGADTVGRDSRDYDAGRKINGRKRFIITDTLGLRSPTPLGGGGTLGLAHPSAAAWPVATNATPPSPRPSSAGLRSPR